MNFRYETTDWLSVVCGGSSSKKYAKRILFGLKTHFKKIVLGYFCPPTLPIKNMVSNWSLNMFYRGAPPIDVYSRGPLW